MKIGRYCRHAECNALRAGSENAIGEAFVRTAVRIVAGVPRASALRKINPVNQSCSPAAATHTMESRQMSEDSTNRLDVFQELRNLQEYDYKFRDETAGGPSVFYALVEWYSVVMFPNFESTYGALR